MFLNSIGKGLSNFDVYENNTATTDLYNLNSYEEMASTYLYDSHTSYSLKYDLSAYHNLDDKSHMMSFGSIREFDDHHVVQCGFEKNTAAGAILVGSSRGLWAKYNGVEQDVARTLSNLQLPPTHLAARIDRGLTLLRKVVRTEEHPGSGNEVCSKLHTVAIHPLELFSKMRTKTIGESPFQHVYSEDDPLQEMNQARKRTPDIDFTSMSPLQRELLEPDLPALTCRNGYDQKVNSYMYYLSKACIEYNAEVPGSFNFNYGRGNYYAINLRLCK